jgi:hypothetical protein
MNQDSEKPVEIRQLPEPDLKLLHCPFCNSSNLAINHSRRRTIADIGTKQVRKWLEFESLHLKCNACACIFPCKREEIIPGLSATKEVLENVLLYHFKFGNSEQKTVELMETFYSVQLKPKTILQWIKRFGKAYCKANDPLFKTNFETCSGHLALDGTFPKCSFQKEDELLAPAQGKKKQVPWVYLTALPDGTLCAIWEEAKTKRI